MADKTIRELSEELGVSKQRIQQVVDNLPTSKKPQKINNRYVININIQKEIKKNIQKSKNESNKENNKFGDKKTTSENDYLSVITMQLKEKDKQIEQLQKLLEQQQILTLQANKKVERLEMDKEDQEDSLEKEKEKSQGFFARFFNNKEKN
ncbi:MarR family transcriptional regulator [Listeria monocytogenes]